ncbi:MAG: D-glycero-beta-D-manno-heptose 1-phosphate adenylyltransferase [Candidatus Omnitrophota bacterium]
MTIMESKLRTLHALLKEIQRERRRGAKVVFTNGCFDLLHVGHVRLLEKAKRLGDILIVGLNTDGSVRKLKGPSRPVNPARARAEVLSALAAVDHVVLFSEKTPERLIRRIRPDVLVKGGDWEKKQIVGSRFVESYGGKVFRFPAVQGFSTTGLLECSREAHGH